MPAATARTRTARRGLALTAAFAALATACTGGGDGAASPTTTIETTTTTVVERQSDGSLLIGVYLPVTGEGSELGQPMVAAIDEALARINEAGGVLGTEVRTVEADEASGTALTDLLDQGVDAIIGPASSLNALSELAPAVDPTTGVVVCSPTATSLALDDFPDSGFLFRTVPSDSMQMTAIADRVEQTGLRSVAVGYLDDPYGRGLRDAFVTEAEAGGLTVVADAGFGADVTDLSGITTQLLDAEPGVIVVLGDSDDGGRLIAALDNATSPVPRVIVNDSIRSARATIQALSDSLRGRLRGVAPRATGNPSRDDAPEGFFTAHAVDCLNLIALAATVAATDAPRTFRTNMASVSADGVPCATFAACAELLADGLNIDYDGVSGSADLANSTGDPSRALFDDFGFDAEGAESGVNPFAVP